MFVRRSFVALCAAAVTWAVLAMSGVAQAETVTIGTTAPKHSPWGKVFRVWNKAVQKKTNGQLELKFFWNNQQGSEEAMVGKIRAGQLDGAAVTAVGLSKVYKPILVLQTPGLITDWATLDRVRDSLAAEFIQGAAKEGFYLGGWGDVGIYRYMSKGSPIRVPGDLKGMTPYIVTGDAIIPTFAQVVGFNGRQMGIAEILPSLNSGRINVCFSPMLAAEQLQWAPRLEYLTDHAMAVGIGAIVFSNKSMERLPADLRDVLKSTAKKAGLMLTKRIRKEDEEAYGRIKGRMKVIQLSPAEIAEWDGVFAQLHQRLGQGAFPASLMARAKQLAGK